MRDEIFHFFKLNLSYGREHTLAKPTPAHTVPPRDLRLLRVMLLTNCLSLFYTYNYYIYRNIVENKDPLRVKILLFYTNIKNTVVQIFREIRSIVKK